MRVIKVLPDGTVTTVLNGFPDGSTTPRMTTTYDTPIGIVVGSDNNLHVADPNHAVYKISSSGQGTLVGGKPGEAGNSD
jgi:hypothetical protein